MRSLATSIVASFDRTYEGLKQKINQYLKESPERAFDRTYEGLKLVRAERARAGKSLPFDRTYEGLKLLAADPAPHEGADLLTVPMRV